MTGLEPSAPQPTGAGAVHELVLEAQKELRFGELLLEQRNWDEARLAFDRAVDLLLGVEGGAARHPEVQAVYARLVDQIHTLEVQELKTASEEPPAEALWQEELDSALDVSELSEGASNSPSSSHAKTYDIPIEYNARVAAIVEMFQERRREWFQAALRRSGRYIDFAKEVFRREGLPEDLVYLGMVESAFKTQAVSRAGARGIWQFVYGTGRLYGLSQDHWIDDRFDPDKSTRAAARHLKDLFEEFGDWHLVMAAYNAGANRVRGAIARAGTRDFWKLSRTRYLRRETKSYVPLILATIVMAKDPARYGFDTRLDPSLRYDAVLIDAPMDLGTAARCAGTTLEEMKRLNPELRRWVTPLNRSEHVLKIPEGSLDRFCAALEEIPPEERVRFLTYTVARGDTLSHIARRYRTTVDAVADANRIGRRSVIRPGQVLTVPVPAGTLPRQALSRPDDRTRSVPASGGSTYTVRKGDTLSAIARAHGISLSNLQRWNGLVGRSLIHPGQKLVIGEDGPSNHQRRVLYRVRRGDTLSKIAHRFSVSVADLRRWNNLYHDRIIAGDSLEIYTPPP